MAHQTILVLNVEGFRSYCLSKPGAREEYPFGEDVMVLKVGGKIFALADAVTFEQISIKGEPEKIVENRERFASVIPGYHLNKKHWNTVLMDGTVPDKLVMSWIDDSYHLIVDSLPKNIQAKLRKK